MDQHDIYSYCKYNKKCDIDDICNRLCYEKTEISMNEVCEKCITDFYNTFKNKIDDEIKNGNTSAMIFVGSVYRMERRYNVMEKYYNMAIDDNDALYHIGTYYGYIRNNFVEMKKYFLMAIDKNNVRAMHALGYYYKNTEKQYYLMKKYYFMAIYPLLRQTKDFSVHTIELSSDNPVDDNNYCIVQSLTDLASYYQHNEKKYDLMEKYYLFAIIKKSTYALDRMLKYYKDQNNYEKYIEYCLLAIKNNMIYAMHQLGDHYKLVEHNNDLAKKYYLMGIDNNDVSSMIKLGKHYEYYEKNYDLAKKYYLMGIEQKSSESAYCLAQCYYKLNDCVLSEKYYLMAMEYNHPYAFIEMRNMTNIIRIYHLFENRDLLMIHLYKSEKTMINDFIKNATMQICQVCYLEKKCCLKDEIYVCGLCH